MALSGNAWKLSLRRSPFVPPVGITINTRADLDSAMSTYGVVGGVTLVLSSTNTVGYNYTFTQTPALPIIIQGPSNAQRAPLTDVLINGAGNLVFRYLDMGRTDSQTGACVSTTNGGHGSSLTFDYCEFYGKFLSMSGNYGFGVFPTGTPGPDQPTRRGIQTIGSGSYMSGLQVTNCDFHDLESGVKGTMRGAPYLIESNFAYRIYTDAFSPFLSPGTVMPNRSALRRNKVTQRMSSNADYGAPHSDAFQMSIVGATSADVLSMVDISYNEVWDGPPGTFRGPFQNIFLSDISPGAYRFFKIYGNRRISSSGDSQLLVLDGDGGAVFGHLGARQDPGGTSTESNTITAGRSSGTYDTSVTYSVYETMTVSGVLHSINANQRLVDNSLAEYQRIFAGPTFNPQSWTDVDSMYALNPSGPLSMLNGYVNYATGDVDLSKERSQVNFRRVSGATAGSVSTSQWVPVIGGGNGQTITLASGMECRFADDENGTNPTPWTSAPGTVDEWRFMQVRQTNSASAGVSTVGAITINGWVSYFVSTVAQSASFSTSDNQGSAFSLLSTPASLTGISRLWFAIQLRVDAFPGAAAGQKIFSNGSTFLWELLSSNLPRFQLSSSGTCRINGTAAPPLGQFVTHAFAFDFTATDINSVAKWFVDYYPVTFSSVNSPSIAGTVTFNQATIFNAVRAFAAAAGANPLNGAINMIACGYGNSSYTLPDFSNPAVFDKLGPDLIGANGSGITGAQPQIYLPGGAVSWNAGQPNVGTLPITLALEGGSYAP